MLHNTSCHPYEHKEAAFNYLYNRIHTYKLTKENKKREEEFIAQILENNEYPPQIKNKDQKKSPTNNTIQNTNGSSLHTLAPTLK
jgi:hypothetical protein